MGGAVTVTTDCTGTFAGVNNLIEPGSVGLGAAPPSNEMLTLTSSDPTRFLLSTDVTKVGTNQIKLPLTAGSLNVPSFYVEGQNFSGAGAVTATLTASAAGYSDGTFTLTLYPTGVSYWPGSGGTLNTTTTSSPSVFDCLSGAAQSRNIGCLHLRVSARAAGSRRSARVREQH